MTKTELCRDRQYVDHPQRQKHQMKMTRTKTQMTMRMMLMATPISAAIVAVSWFACVSVFVRDHVRAPSHDRGHVSASSCVTTISYGRDCDDDVYVVFAHVQRRYRCHSHGRSRCRYHCRCHSDQSQKTTPNLIRVRYRSLSR